MLDQLKKILEDGKYAAIEYGKILTRDFWSRG